MMFVPIKWAHKLNVFPPSPKKIVALIAQCTTRKEMRKIPVRAIQNFFVIEDLNKPEAIIIECFARAKIVLKTLHTNINFHLDAI